MPLPSDYASSARRARLVLVLTIVTMAAELATGYSTGSLALVADGWHMGSHAAALGITAFAYAYARRHAENDRFSFGTGKVSALAGYSSALLLAVVAFLVATEAIERLVDPTPVDFHDALIVAVIGLVVNVTSAFVLAGGLPHRHHDHAHDHGHRRAPGAHGSHAHLAEHGHDHNLRAAYLHVVADALTSVLAIGALTLGLLMGWVWLDPLVGLAASLLIAWWAAGLLRSSGRVLMDAEDYASLRNEIARAIETEADNRVADVRAWSLGGTARAAIVSVVTHQPRTANHYKALLADVPDLHLVTVEVHHCDIDPCDVHASTSS